MGTFACKTFKICLEVCAFLMFVKKLMRFSKKAFSSLSRSFWDNISLITHILIYFFIKSIFFGVFIAYSGRYFVSFHLYGYTRKKHNLILKTKEFMTLCTDRLTQVLQTTDGLKQDVISGKITVGEVATKAW